MYWMSCIRQQFMLHVQFQVVVYSLEIALHSDVKGYFYTHSEELSELCQKNLHFQ